MTFDEMLRKAQTTWARDQLTPRTIQVYSTNLRRLEREVGLLGPEAAHNWARWHARVYRALDAGRVSASKLNGDLAAARAFYRVVGTDPTQGLQGTRPPDKQPRPLDREILVRLFAQPDTTTPEGFQDRVCLELGYGAGLRTNELCCLNMGGVEYASEVDSLRLYFRAKGGKEHKVLLRRESAALLARHLGAEAIDEAAALARRRPKDAPVFTHRGRRMSTREIDRRLQRYREAAGVPARFHQLRHTFVSALFDAGADAFAVKELARHAKMETTLHYLQQSERRKFGELAKLPLVED